jgi:ABC-2 type transport system ATP-binding protein
MQDNVIVVKDLTKSFKNTAVLSGVNFEVKRGTMLALLGPNGAGKTTTIRILSTLLKPDGGTVTISGHNVVTDADRVRENIGLTGQYAAVDEFLNAVENLEMMGRLYHLSHAVAKQRATELLDLFDLTEASLRPVKTYSGGMRRKLDLALSLIATPPVIFLDEPTTGLDPRSRLAMWDVIKQLMASGATILLTTQYLEEADQLADQIAVIDNGRIIAQGTADELKSQVGKDRLELTIHKDSDFTAAARAVESNGLIKNTEDRMLSVSMEGDVSEVKTILDKLEKAGVKVETLSLHKPTLDDVFMKLTGHKAEEAKAAVEGESK